MEIYALIAVFVAAGLVYGGLYLYLLWRIHCYTTPRDGWAAQEERDAELYERLNAEFQATHSVTRWEDALREAQNRLKG